MPLYNVQVHGDSGFPLVPPLSATFIDLKIVFEWNIKSVGAIRSDSIWSLFCEGVKEEEEEKRGNG